MAFTALSNTEIAVGKPITQELMQKIKDNFDYLAGLQDPGLSGVFNGSFENDTDSDGIPDGWTRNLYPGGAGAIISTSGTIGAKSYQFTHPGGAGNGGGYLDSEYIEINENISPAVQASVYSNAALVLEIVCRYYDKDKVYISDETLYTVSTSLGAWVEKSLYGIPPANAKFMKVRLIGGKDSASTAGVARFDNVRVEVCPRMLSENVPFSQNSTNSNSFATLTTATCKLPKGFSRMLINANLDLTGTQVGAYGELRYYIGGTVSTTVRQHLQVNSTHIMNDAQLDLALPSSGSTSVTLQGMVSNASNTVYGSNLGGTIVYLR